MKYRLVLLMLLIGLQSVSGQNDGTQRSGFHFLFGPSGANIRDFNEMLASKGISPLRKGYNSIGLGYQNRFNDFIAGLEMIHNYGPTSDFREYEIDYRSSRLYLNIGYSFTEAEERMQLIHYMSLGMGYLNFEMLRENNHRSFPEFLQHPADGFIIRQKNIHMGSWHMGGFLTEIGFQLGYDFLFPGGEETVELVGKFGYSFSPFENAWNNKGIAFDNIQSGAFLRVGAGIALKDQNYFYRDATLGLHLIFGKHITNPSQLNAHFGGRGFNPLPKNPSNLGIKILGENRGRLYSVDVYNLALKERATENYRHTLNSVRVYGNLGKKLYEGKTLELGVLAGVGYGNLRYTLEHLQKPDFPGLFEEPDYDGYLTAGGVLAKPEIYLAYLMPLSNQSVFDLVYAVHTGYELPVNNYKLAGVEMRKYMAGPYLHLSIGIRP